MTTPTDWQALCAELADELDAETGYTKNNGERITHPTVAEARAALAQPEAESSITFNESRDSEVIRVDQRGFHYRGELIEDAGLAHRLMVTYLQRHTSMHPEVVEREDAQQALEQ